MEAKKKKEITFARPAFAQELLTEENKKKFDALPAWQRHFIKRTVEHGDLVRAAQEAGVSTYIGKNIDFKLADEKSIDQAMTDGGLTTDKFVAHLMDCLDCQVMKIDKHGNPFPYEDKQLKLKTLELIAKMRGWLERRVPKSELPTGVAELFEDTPVE